MIFIQKENEQVKSYFIKANEKIDSGDAESALEYVTKLEESKEKNLANYYLAPLYIDIGVATITGRYPESGYCVNLVSKELVYILEGSGKLYFEDHTIDFSESDAILIENNKKYYWETDYCKVSMTCSPAWSPEQYKVVDEKKGNKK